MTSANHEPRWVYFVISLAVVAFDAHCARAQSAPPPPVLQGGVQQNVPPGDVISGGDSGPSTTNQPGVGSSPACRIPGSDLWPRFLRSVRSDECVLRRPGAIRPERDGNGRHDAKRGGQLRNDQATAGITGQPAELPQRQRHTVVPKVSGQISGMCGHSGRQRNSRSKPAHIRRRLSVSATEPGGGGSQGISGQKSLQGGIKTDIQIPKGMQGFLINQGQGKQPKLCYWIARGQSPLCSAVRQDRC
jgi:hypothetical protein